MPTGTRGALGGCQRDFLVPQMLGRLGSKPGPSFRTDLFFSPSYIPTDVGSVGPAVERAPPHQNCSDKLFCMGNFKNRLTATKAMSENEHLYTVGTWRPCHRVGGRVQLSGPTPGHLQVNPNPTSRAPPGHPRTQLPGHLQGNPKPNSRATSRSTQNPHLPGQL